ncbi:hypothetical protein ACJJTC_013434, partial [Scirpophaga incertulas]
CTTSRRRWVRRLRPRSGRRRRREQWERWERRERRARPRPRRRRCSAWITLQSIPEETTISPHILEFLEQALEPIPTKPFSAPAPTPEGGSEAGSRPPSSYGQYGQYVYASFPVDVIVHFHMQPSTFRFSCLPASRVECLLQLPSLQIIFSSKRATDEEMSRPGVAMGGLSVTGCLADFSVYVFHPYGGKKSSPQGGAVVAAAGLRAQGLAQRQRGVRQVPPVALAQARLPRRPGPLQGHRALLQ